MKKSSESKNTPLKSIIFFVLGLAILEFLFGKNGSMDLTRLGLFNIPVIIVLIVIYFTAKPKLSAFLSMVFVALLIYLLIQSILFSLVI